MVVWVSIVWVSSYFLCLTCALLAFLCIKVCVFPSLFACSLCSMCAFVLALLLCVFLYWFWPLPLSVSLPLPNNKLDWTDPALPNPVSHIPGTLVTLKYLSTKQSKSFFRIKWRKWIHGWVECLTYINQKHVSKWMFLLLSANRYICEVIRSQCCVHSLMHHQGTTSDAVLVLSYNFYSPCMD